MAATKTEQALELVRQMGVLRPRDLEAHGLSREYLRRLEQRGLVQRSSRGIYFASDADLTENHSLAEACKRVPHGVACLLTALEFYNFTTQAPFEIWMAIDVKARLPKVDDLPLRIFRFSGQAFTYGIQEYAIEGVRVRVYNPAKTVADCFKYRHKIGLDVALEAVRDARRKRLCTMDDIWYAARACRVDRIMQPYLEGMVA